MIAAESELISNVFTEIFQGRDYLVHFLLHSVLLVLEASHPFLNVDTILTSCAQLQDEIFGGLDDLPADLTRGGAGGAEHVLLVGIHHQLLVGKVRVEEEDTPAEGESPEDVPALEDRSYLPPQPAGWKESPQQALASQEVGGISQQGGLSLGDDLHPADVSVDLRLLPDEPGVADRQAVEEVHQDHDNQEYKQQEEDVAEGGVERNIGELEFANEHREGLDQSESDSIEERILFIRISVVIVEQNVEREGEGNNKEGVPSQEGDEGLEYAVEHCGVNVTGGHLGMSTNHGDQQDPGDQKDGA